MIGIFHYVFMGMYLLPERRKNINQVKMGRNDKDQTLVFQYVI